MREILFRGKRIDNGEWAYGGYREEKIGEYHVAVFIIEHLTSGVYENHRVNYKTVGQYTGLTDKNGTKIFEGDIIRYADVGEYKMYLESLECPEEYEGVDFSNMWTIDSVGYGIAIGYPAFDLNNHEWECNGLSILNESYQYYYEVIGNIHDNPEMMKGDK